MASTPWDASRISGSRNATPPAISVSGGISAVAASSATSAAKVSVTVNGASLPDFVRTSATMAMPGEGRMISRALRYLRASVASGACCQVWSMRLSNTLNRPAAGSTETFSRSFSRIHRGPSQCTRVSAAGTATVAWTSQRGTSRIALVERDRIREVSLGGRRDTHKGNTVANGLWGMPLEAVWIFEQGSSTQGPTCCPVSIGLTSGRATH